MAFSTGKALFAKIDEGTSGRSWHSVDVNQECVYEVQGTGDGTYDLPTELRVE
jgi:hypothetical protein